MAKQYRALVRQVGSRRKPVKISLLAWTMGNVLPDNNTLQIGTANYRLVQVYSVSAMGMGMGVRSHA